MHVALRHRRGIVCTLFIERFIQVNNPASPSGKRAGEKEGGKGTKEERERER